VTSVLPLPPTHYRVTLLDSHAHLFEVACTVEQPDAEGQRFRLPVWIPGSYLIREFARNVVAIRAESGDMPVGLDKEAKDTWRAAPCVGQDNALVYGEWLGYGSDGVARMHAAGII